MDAVYGYSDNGFGSARIRPLLAFMAVAECMILLLKYLGGDV